MQLGDDLGGILVCLAGVLQRFDLRFQEIRRLKDKIENLLGNADQRLGGFADDGEYVLDGVRKRGDAVQPHHGCRALDGVHDAKDLVDVFMAEVLRFFRIQKDLIQLVEQRCILVDKQLHWFHVRVKIHWHNYPP